MIKTEVRKRKRRERDRIQIRWMVWVDGWTYSRRTGSSRRLCVVMNIETDLYIFCFVFFDFDYVKKEKIKRKEKEKTKVSVYELNRHVSAISETMEMNRPADYGITYLYKYINTGQKE